MLRDKFKAYITIYQENDIFHFYIFKSKEASIALKLGFTIDGNMIIDYNTGIIKVKGKKVLIAGKPLMIEGLMVDNIYKVNFVVHNGCKG